MTTEFADWQEHFDRWGARLLLFARQRTRSLADAEDVVQEAFIKVWRTYGNQKPITPALLFTAVRTTAIDFARSKSRREIREAKVCESSEGDRVWFHRTLEEQENQAALENAIQQLPENQQEVLILKTWGELTFDEIGTTLEISPNTAASRYRYGLENLKKQLTPSLI